MGVVIAAPALPLPARATDPRDGPARSGHDRAPSERIDRLIHQLGAKTFAARQRAQRDLAAAGLSAKDALAMACGSHDAEVRQRARQALDEVLDVDFQVRLAAFLADDGREGHGLPCWNRYQSLAGDGPLARRWFGDMQRAERELLNAAVENPKQAGDVLEARCVRAGQALSELGASSRRGPQVPAATLAAFLLVAADDDVPISATAGDYLYRFCQQRAVEQSFARNSGGVLRRLFVAWIERRFSPDSLVAYRNLLLAMENDVPEALAPATALLSGGGGQAYLLPWAILAVGKFGGAEQMPVLEPLLNDSRSIAAPNRGRQDLDAEVRDVALAVLVHLSGQPLADYGFSQARMQPTYLMVADSLGFNDPAARDRALKKWRERGQGTGHRGQGTGDRE